MLWTADFYWFHWFVSLMLKFQIAVKFQRHFIGDGWWRDVAKEIYQLSKKISSIPCWIIDKILWWFQLYCQAKFTTSFSKIKGKWLPHSVKPPPILAYSWKLWMVIIVIISVLQGTRNAASVFIAIQHNVTQNASGKWEMWLISDIIFKHSLEGTFLLLKANQSHLTICAFVKWL